MTTPHLILISNSNEGIDGEFYKRNAEDGYGELGNPQPHEPDHYEEHEAHLSKVLKFNFALIFVGFFGQHDKYPFDLSPETAGCSNKDGQTRCEENDGFGGRALEQHLRSCQGRVELMNIPGCTRLNAST